MVHPPKFCSEHKVLGDDITRSMTGRWARSQGCSIGLHTMFHDSNKCVFVCFVHSWLHSLFCIVFTELNKVMDFYYITTGTHKKANTCVVAQYITQIQHLFRAYTLSVTYNTFKSNPLNEHIYWSGGCSTCFFFQYIILSAFKWLSRRQTQHPLVL